MARILVVEDEETLAEAISFLLSKEGFEVEIAANGPCFQDYLAPKSAVRFVPNLQCPSSC